MAISELNSLVRRCFHTRLSATEFHQIIVAYRRRSPFASKDVVSAFLNNALLYCMENDPLIPQYLQIIILHDVIKLSDLITGLFLQWRGVGKADKREAVLKLVNLHTRLLAEINHFLGQLSGNENRRCVLVIGRWLEPLVRWASSNTVKEHNMVVNLLPETVGYLFAVLLNSSVLASKQIYTSVQHMIDQCVDVFPAVAVQLMNKLSTVPKPDLLNDERSASPNTMNMATFQFEANLQETPIAGTRLATTILLNSLLRTASYIDDGAIFAFLDARHQSDHAVMFNEILFASIDAMIKTSDSRNEAYQAQCALYMYNKLPAILIIIHQAGFETFSSESFLTDAWTYLSASTDIELVNIGRKFIHICAVHQLILSSSASALVGEDTLGALKGIPAKDDLVNLVTSNPARGLRLIDELQKNDGSVGIISQAVTEIMGKFCQTKDLQNLKNMTNAVTRKPFAINAISLFVKTQLFLGPFCTLLDEWKWDDIHGESQPVYDEFGSILLLVLAFKRRLNLNTSKLGIQRKDGFLAKYIAMNHADQELSRLSEADQNHLGDWIQSLYIAEGLSDDLTSNCSAQNFYLLVPTLLRQSVMALNRGKLTQDTFKAGLEYLLEPFLLPSLLSVFGWIERVANKETKAAVLIMQTLTKPPSNSEAKDIHQTIMSMAADRFERCNLRSDSPLLPIVKSMKTKSFTIDSSLKQIDVSIAGADNTLDSMSRVTVSQAIGGDDPYNSVLLNTVIALHGPAQAAETLVNILIQSSESHGFHSTLDLVATIANIKQDVRHAIQLMHAKLATWLKSGENLTAGAIVHLHRRSELYNTALMAESLGIDHTFTPLAGMNVANINLDANPSVAFDQIDQVQPEDIDQVLNEAAMGGVDQVNTSAFDDMYGLPAGDFGLENLDDLDLDMF